jgi:hypothetical protein
MMDRYAPSMRQRIDIEKLWRAVRDQLMLAEDIAQRQAIAGLPARCPFSLDDLIAERIDSSALLERLRAGAIRGG